MEGYWIVVVVPFTHQNAPYADLSAIHHDSFTASWDAETFEALLCGFGTKGLCVQDPEIKGFILYRQPFDDAEILTICVSDQHKGYGSMLVSAMLEELKRPGKCFLEVSPKNIPALKLYEKFNFKIVHTRKDYYDAGEDAYMMMRIL